MSTTTRRRPMPAVRCFKVHEVWGPHDGCREFMARPDTFLCRQPATHVVKGVDPYDGPYKDLGCGEHAAEAVADDATVRAYRFRSI